MGIFTDYAASRRQITSPVDAARNNPFFAEQPIEQPQLPQIDSDNAIGSLAVMLGPTPAEREARERRALESKAKMSAWAGLFDGMRQLGNLYYTYKGATPQQLASPYQAIDNEINQQRTIADANDNYRRQYAQSLYNLRRQMSDDARRDLLAQAQADYYGTRDEVTRMKAENDKQKLELDKLKAVKVIKQKDGSLMKFDPVSGNVEPLTEADPLYQDYMRSMINKNNRTNTGGGRSSGGRNNGTYGYKTTTYYDEQGRKVTERVPTTGGVPERRVQEPKKPASQSGKGTSGKGKDKYKNTRALGL